MSIISLLRIIRSQSGIYHLGAMYQGGLDGKILSIAEVEQLASLPSLDELRGKLVGLIKSPSQKLVSVSVAPANKLVNIFHAKASQ